jgi:hypothetical protein
MLDVIYNKLKASNDPSISEWKDVDPIIFNKHVQYTHETNASNVNKDDILIELKNKPIIDICEVCEVAIKKENVLHKNTPVISKNKKKHEIGSFYKHQYVQKAVYQLLQSLYCK